MKQNGFLLSEEIGKFPYTILHMDESKKYYPQNGHRPKKLFVKEGLVRCQNNGQGAEFGPF